MSGMVLPRREFAGRQIDADIDDNSIALVDFGSGVFAVVHGTAGGTVIDDFAAARYFGHRRGDRRPAAEQGAIRLPRPRADHGRGNLGLGYPDARAAARDRAAPADPRVTRLRGHHAAGRLGPRRRAIPVSAEHARHVIDIIENTYRSAASGRTESLSTTFDW
jgi:predicted dehydrogenase